jgi:hypothetical protein
MKYYSIDQASYKTGLSKRWLQKKCKAINLEKSNGQYKISDSLIIEWKRTKSNVTKEKDVISDVITNNKENVSKTPKNVSDAKVTYIDGSADEILVPLSPAEYDKLNQLIHNEKLMSERIEDYKNEIQYLRNSLDKSHEQFGILLKKMEQSLSLLAQRNWIEAIEKKKDLNDDDFTPTY